MAAMMMTMMMNMLLFLVLQRHQQICLYHVTLLMLLTLVSSCRKTEYKLVLTALSLHFGTTGFILEIQTWKPEP